MSSIKKNTIFLSISIFIRLVTNSFLFIFIARFYGPEVFGVFSTAFTFATMMIVLADFGFDMLINSELARNRDDINKVVSQLLAIKILFSVSAFFLIWVVTFFWTTSPVFVGAIRLLSFYSLFTTLTNFFWGSFRGLEKFQYEAKISFVSNLLLLIVLSPIFYFKLHIYYIACAIVVQRFIAFYLTLTAAKKEGISCSPTFSFPVIKERLSTVAVFGFHLLFGMLFFQIDSLLILRINGEGPAGIYQSVFRIMAIVLVFPEIVFSSFFPKLTFLFSNKDNDWQRIALFMMKVLFYSGIFAFLIFYFFGYEILALLYGKKEFLSAVSLMQYAGLILLIRFIAEPLAAFLTVKNQQSKRLYVVFFATIFNIAVNFVFLPIYSIKGAIITSLVTNILVLFGYIYYSRIEAKEFLNQVKWPILLLIVFLIVVFPFIHEEIMRYLSFVSFMILVFILFYRWQLTNEERRWLLSWK